MLGRMKVKTLGSRAQSETSVYGPTWMWRPTSQSGQMGIPGLLPHSVEATFPSLCD